MESWKGCVKVVIIISIVYLDCLSILTHPWFCLFIQTITLPHFRPLPVVISSFQVYHSWKFNNECHFYDCVSSKNTFGSARTHTVFILTVANLAAFCVRWEVGNWFSTAVFITHNFEGEYNGFLYAFSLFALYFWQLFGANCKVHRHLAKREKKIWRFQFWSEKQHFVNLVSETSGDQYTAYVSIHSYWTPIRTVLFRLKSKLKNLAICLHFLLRYSSVLSSSRCPSFSLLLFVYIIYL